MNLAPLLSAVLIFSSNSGIGKTCPAVLISPSFVLSDPTCSDNFSGGQITFSFSMQRQSRASQRPIRELSVHFLGEQIPPDLALYSFRGPLPLGFKPQTILSDDHLVIGQRLVLLSYSGGEQIFNESDATVTALSTETIEVSTHDTSARLAFTEDGHCVGFLSSRPKSFVRLSSAQPWIQLKVNGD